MAVLREGVLRMDVEVASTLQEMLKCNKGNLETKEIRAIVRSVPSRHDNKAALLYPQPPDPNIRWPTRPLILRAPSQHSLAYSETAVYTQPRPVQEEVYNLPPNRTRSESPSKVPRAWWHKRWPPFSPADPRADIDALQSVHSDELSDPKPKVVKPPRSAQAARLDGTIEHASTILHKGMGKEEIEVLRRQQELSAVVSLLGVTLPPLDARVKSKIMIKTVDYFPLVPGDHLALRLDTRFAVCRYQAVVGKCMRGVVCPYLHNTNRPRENLRRIFLKVLARVHWITKAVDPVYPPDLTPSPLPEPKPWRWTDQQSAKLTFWVITRPPELNPEQCVADIVAEMRRGGNKIS
eukprot:gene16608-25474_t